MPAAQSSTAGMSICFTPSSDTRCNDTRTCACPPTMAIGAQRNAFPPSPRSLSPSAHFFRIIERIAAMSSSYIWPVVRIAGAGGAGGLGCPPCHPPRCPSVPLFAPDACPALCFGQSCLRWPRSPQPKHLPALTASACGHSSFQWPVPPQMWHSSGPASRRCGRICSTRRPPPLPRPRPEPWSRPRSRSWPVWAGSSRCSCRLWAFLTSSIVCCIFFHSRSSPSAFRTKQPPRVCVTPHSEQKSAAGKRGAVSSAIGAACTGLVCTSGRMPHSSRWISIFRAAATSSSNVALCVAASAVPTVGSKPRMNTRCMSDSRVVGRCSSRIRRANAVTSCDAVRSNALSRCSACWSVVVGYARSIAAHISSKVGSRPPDLLLALLFCADVSRAMIACAHPSSCAFHARR